MMIISLVLELAKTEKKTLQILVKSSRFMYSIHSYCFLLLYWIVYVSNSSRCFIKLDGWCISIIYYTLSSLTEFALLLAFLLSSGLSPAFSLTLPFCCFSHSAQYQVLQLVFKRSLVFTFYWLYTTWASKYWGLSGKLIPSLHFSKV